MSNPEAGPSQPKGAAGASGSFVEPSSSSAPTSASTPATSTRPAAAGASSSSLSSSSTQPAYYTFSSEHPQHADDSLPPRPLEPVSLPRPSPSLREPPAPDIIPPVRPTLAQFRQAEGPVARAAKLRGLWEALPTLPDLGDGPTPTQNMQLPGQDTKTALSPERAERLRKLYEEELVRRCREERPEARLWGGADEQPDMRDVLGKGISFESFRRFLWDKERELWDTFQEIDKNGDGRLDATELRAALSRSGVDITPETVGDLVHFLSSGGKASVTQGGKVKVPGDVYITFGDFRDFLIMLPRRATPFEIYKFYQVRKRFTDGRGAARVDKEGDLNVSFPKRPPPQPPSHSMSEQAQKEDSDFADQIDAETHPEEKHEAWRFLLAGGIAGAVSRTVTAPFDRLKIYLITTDKVFVPAAPAGSSAAGTAKAVVSPPMRAMHNLAGAMIRIYKDGGGVRAFWVGNGLNVTKIFPESAIKFVSYEQSKRFLAKYWDKVSDPSELSSSSRFVAGGIGGNTSKLSIYGLETLKTRVQSEIGPEMGWRQVWRTAQRMWVQGGLRTYYRGLTLGLVGVFPYSAIDMGTYETLKNAYCRSMKTDEPPVYAVLSFGALSGSIGAASVYPVNLLRTRLQASGSSGHPHKYTGFGDVLKTTLQNEGWRGLYKGLLPTILKVGPAVGVSWIVYEEAKRKLGV